LNQREVKGPFVGLRPFRRSEAPLLFGRTDDTRRILNLVLSNPLTVVYGASGVGKTSLLRACLAQDLDDEDAVVVTFDRWSAQNVFEALVGEIEAEIGDAPWAGSPEGEPSIRDVADWIDKWTRREDRPVVLVLDQFEQALVRATPGLDQVGRLLATAARSATELATVISLREEFVGALDGLRDWGIDPYRTTYRLAPLDRACTAQVVTASVEAVKATVEPDFVEALLDEIRTEKDNDDTAGVVGAPEYPLVYVQLICRELWDRWAAHSGRMTLDHYERAGRRDGIMARYLDTWTEGFSPTHRDVMRRAIRFFAPENGVKVAFEVSALAEAVEAEEGDVEHVVSSLKRRFVFRERGSPRGVSYELFHDALIPVLRGWAQEETGRVKQRLAAAHQARNRRRQAVLGLAVVVLAVVAAVFFRLYTDLDEAKRERASAEQKVDSAKRWGETRSAAWREFSVGLVYALSASRGNASVVARHMRRDDWADHTRRGVLERLVDDSKERSGASRWTTRELLDLDEQSLAGALVELTGGRDAPGRDSFRAPESRAGEVEAVVLEILRAAPGLAAGAIPGKEEETVARRLEERVRDDEATAREYHWNGRLQLAAGHLAEAKTSLERSSRMSPSPHDRAFIALDLGKVARGFSRPKTPPIPATAATSYRYWREAEAQHYLDGAAAQSGAALESVLLHRAAYAWNRVATKLGERPEDWDRVIGLYEDALLGAPAFRQWRTVLILRRLGVAHRARSMTGRHALSAHDRAWRIADLERSVDVLRRARQVALELTPDVRARLAYELAESYRRLFIQLELEFESHPGSGAARSAPAEVASSAPTAAAQAAAAAIRSFRESLWLAPDGRDAARAESQLGYLYKKTGDFRLARIHLRTALRLNPADSGTLNRLGWLSAECPDPQIRSWKDAIAYGSRACGQQRRLQPSCLDTMAAAWALRGAALTQSQSRSAAAREHARFSFDFAKALQRQVVALAKRGNVSAKPLAAYRERLRLYAAGKPYVGKRPGISLEGTNTKPWSTLRP